MRQHNPTQKKRETPSVQFRFGEDKEKRTKHSDQNASNQSSYTLSIDSDYAPKKPRRHWFRIPNGRKKRKRRKRNLGSKRIGCREREKAAKEKGAIGRGKSKGLLKGEIEAKAKIASLHRESKKKKKKKKQRRKRKARVVVAAYLAVRRSYGDGDGDIRAAAAAEQRRDLTWQGGDRRGERSVKTEEERCVCG